MAEWESDQPKLHHKPHKDEWASQQASRTAVRAPAHAVHAPAPTRALPVRADDWDDGEAWDAQAAPAQSKHKAHAQDDWETVAPSRGHGARAQRDVPQDQEAGHQRGLGERGGDWGDDAAATATGGEWGGSKKPHPSAGTGGKQFKLNKPLVQPIVPIVPKEPLIKLRTVPRIISGDLALRVDCYDTPLERVGFAYQVTKYALQAVGLIEALDYHFVSARADAVVQHASQQAGSALQTGYADAATGFHPTLMRRQNFAFGLPLHASNAQARLWRLGGSTEPLPAVPVIGILADGPFESRDLANSGLKSYSLVYFLSTELGCLQDTVVSKLASGQIDLLLYYSQLYDQQGQALLEPHGAAFATGKYPPAFLVNKGAPNAKRLVKAYNQGLKLIVDQGIYQALWEESGCTLPPWTPRNFPDLKHPKTKAELELAALLG